MKRLADYILSLLVVVLLGLLVLWNHTLMRELRRVEEIAVLSLEERYYSVTLTAYTANKVETDSTPWVTATMTKTRPGRTAAVSRDLLPYLLGRTIYIPGYGVWDVEDTMHERYTNSVDLCVGTAGQAKNFGRKTLVIVVLK